ncbi:MAG: ABC-F family ATP-binding cassette domain-containing protein, partial [Myxococcales bacterium]|nr:ABC-F family ATP-binding cassette domain-containing protein [Myxococcales bacterium]
MIHLKGLSKAFGPQQIFEDLDWHIKPAQRVGLIGPNGVGKSTLLRIITGEIAPDGGEVAVTRGVTLGYLPQEVATLAGTSVREEARRGLERVLEVAAALRDVEAQLATANGEAAERLMETYAELQARFERLDGFKIENRVEEVLQGLGFKAADFDRDCGELSGGWQMRVVLARLLLQRPEVLLLDEPTNHLDLESVVWLEAFLQSFPGSLVFISHDRWFIDRLATHIAELSGDGVRVFPGDFERYLEQVEQDRALAERRQRNQERRAAQLERFISRFRYKASKARQVQSRVKMLEKMDRIDLREDARTIRFELPEPPKSGRVVLELRDVRQAYGEREIYRGLDIDLLRGQRVALVGPNGAGKSTLLKALAGLIPYQGSVALDGAEIRSLDRRDRARRL